MIKTYSFMAFICLMFVTAGFIPVSAQTQTDKTDASIAKVKADVLKRGKVFGEIINLEMQNGTKLKGYISQPGEDSFNFTDSKTNQKSTIFYRDVAKVKGNGWSKGAKIGVAAALAGAAAVVLYVVLAPICNEGGC
jgi:hypothetical protein